TSLDGSLLTLVSVDGNQRTPVPFQISGDKQRMLHWIVKSDGNRGKKIFELQKKKPSAFTSIEATKNDGELTIHDGNKNLLRYNYKTVYPPAGIDTVFKRSAFIHPLWTPHGQVLTRIQAPDHYHHYGIWNPWTHVLFEGDTVDFWNLKSRKGTVRFKDFVSIVSGPVYAEYAAHHEHVAFKKDGKEKVALSELQTVRVYKPEENSNYYLVDITIEMKCASESPFLILEYRYAGLGWRATEQWNKDNSEVLTSESKTRKDADGSNAKWFLVQGNLDNDYGGAAMMSHPLNYNHPEPLRIWPENSNKGEMFAMFAPTKNKDWLLSPGQTYTLKYRFVAFNDHLAKEKAESAWSYFATPPTVTVKK
ncbi:MAG TPA: PmoA family protein, partial [Cyclobacteriaceae bacterium]|nr:PmoA family protein [Cyclobacteriaceae bacterium]